MSEKVPDQYRVNLGQLADVTGISETSLRKWLRSRDDFPILKGGSNGVPYEFDVRAVKAWIARNEAEAAAEREAEKQRARQLRLELFGDDGLADEEQQKLSPREERELLQARLVALQINERHGRVLVKADVEATAGAAFGVFRDEALGLVDLFADELGLSREGRVRVEQRVEAMLARLADNLVEFLDEAGDERQERAA